MPTTFCDGVTRRDALRVGTAALFGSSIGLPQLLRAEAARGVASQKDVSLIFVFLHGGQSHLDTYDLKPDAPPEFRGEFNPAKTKMKAQMGIEDNFHRVTPASFLSSAAFTSLQMSRTF